VLKLQGSVWGIAAMMKLCNKRFLDSHFLALIQPIIS
jgi:hypothetical protein